MLECRKRPVMPVRMPALPANAYELASCDQLFSSFRCCIFTYILCHSGCLWLSFSLLLVPTLSSFNVYLTCFKQENRKLVYFLFSRMQHLCFLSKPEQRISSGRPSVTCGGISRWTWAALAGDGRFVTVLTRWLLAELQNSFDDRMTSFEGPTARYTRVISLVNDHNAYLSLMQAISNSEEESNWLPCAQADERQARMRLVVLKQFFFHETFFCVLCSSRPQPDVVKREPTWRTHTMKSKSELQ